MTTAATKLERFEFDEIDQKILAILKANGRATSRKIARTLNISAATVSARIRRMEDIKAIRVVAATDFSAFGYDVLLAIGVEVEERSAEAVAMDLAELPEVIVVHLVTGARDIEMLVAVKDFSELGAFLMEKIAAVEGVRCLELAVAVDTIKYDFDVSVIQ